MNNLPINRRGFYRDPEDRERFFERVMQGAGRPPFAMRIAGSGMRDGKPRLSSRPREQQSGMRDARHELRDAGNNFFPVVVALPDLHKCDQ